MLRLSSAVLDTVHGGFGNGSDGWNDGMSNGCGNGTISVPNGTWRQACVDHDHRYFLGGTQLDRLRADRRLRSDMIQLGASHEVADAYYLGVRAGGKSSWGKVPKHPGSH
jgi:hypothetical protein